MQSGIILLDKKPGITSMACDNFIKRLLGTKKVGHSGTLDPFATGLLPVFVGDALKVMRYTDGYDKSYSCTAVFGRSTNTQDRDGETTGGRLPTAEELDMLEASDYEAVRKAFSEVASRTTQIPPKYSAKKIGGRKAYELAREGETVELPPANVRIDRLEIRSIRRMGETFAADFEVSCSKGTYIRTICEDVGEILEFGAYAQDLRRTGSGPFSVEDAYTEEQLADMHGSGDDSFLLSRENALSHMSSISLSAKDAADVKLGRKISSAPYPDAPESGLFCGTFEGRVIAVLYRATENSSDIFRIDRMLAADGI